MKNKNVPERTDRLISQVATFTLSGTSVASNTIEKRLYYVSPNVIKNLSEILVISSYPPRECGIATYSQDLIKALNNKFSNSLSIRVCALESDDAKYAYPAEVKYKLHTTNGSSYQDLAQEINQEERIQLVLIQHEFGFYKKQEEAFIQLLYQLTKPVVVVFHTVLPSPNDHLRSEVRNMVAACESIVVMTNTSAHILEEGYGIAKEKIAVIPHGTHLVPHLSETLLKKKYGLVGRKVLTTFGLLSSGKSIETTLDSLPAIIQKCPEIIFLIVGKTHPVVAQTDGEVYRHALEQKVKALHLQDHVRFINKYLDLSTLLEYLQLTDIYLFTTKDPNQAVSGTFAYAMSCGCPIISTPIPHAKELLTKDTGIIFDFGNSEQLAQSVLLLLNDPGLRESIIANTLQKIVSTAWENSAVAHAMLFQSISGRKIHLDFNLPVINLNHLRAMTTDVGIIQFSKINQPDIHSGYTLDDNARALIAVSMCFEQGVDKEAVNEIQKHLTFIKFCQQPSRRFLNYVDQEQLFTSQNDEVNLDDSNGRALWALGYLISQKATLPKAMVNEAILAFEKALLALQDVTSPRALAFMIKGIFYFHNGKQNSDHSVILNLFAKRLLNMYKQESTPLWKWYESYLTYANSILPEALLCAWLLTGEEPYKDTAKESFDFLLSTTFSENQIEVISNRGWLQKGGKAGKFGEQPIDVAYTIMTLSKFYDVFQDEEYRRKMEIGFNWFLGENRLHQIIYNPCTGGCYDGLEETHVNMNQGAESTLSYLMARLTIEKYQNEQ